MLKERSPDIDSEIILKDFVLEEKNLFSFPIRLLRQIKKDLNIDNDFVIESVSTSSLPKSNTLLFYKKVTDDSFNRLSELKECIIIVPERKAQLFEFLRNANLIIASHNPRLEYARILQYILACNVKESIKLATYIGESFVKGKGTTIEPNVIIGDNVNIGENCIIKAGTIINSNVAIGNQAIVRENAVIGGSGFGFERDENSIPIHIPHLGGVIIGNNVEIGALSTIVSGTIEPTIIEDYTKIDDHVHIAHNCHIGKRCLITACAEVSGSVKIGDDTWLGPNCSIINGITIGKNCFIGIGAVVKKSVSDDQIVSGDPARPLEEIKEEKDLMKQLLAAYRNGKLIIKE